MRYTDFEADFLIEDAESMVSGLKSAITKLIHASDDPDMLNQIYTVLNRKHIEHLCENISMVNDTVKNHLSVFIDTVLATSGTFEEKEAFLKEYPTKGGYIDEGALLTPNKVRSFSDWLKGGGFSVELFRRLSVHGDLKTGSAGPGEKAFALLDPKIVWTGGSEGGGDIAIGDLKVEIKAKVAKPGRLHDAAKAKYQEQNVADTLAKVGIDLTGKQSLTALDYIKNYYPSLTMPQRKAVADSVVKNMFRFTDKTVGLRAALTNGDFEGIRREFAISSFYNYQATSGFSGILMMDYSTQTTLWFTDIAEVAGLIRADAPQLWGSDRDAMPKVTFVSK